LPFSASYEGQFFAQSATDSGVAEQGGAYGMASFFGPSSAGFYQIVSSTTDASAISGGSFSILGEDGSTVYGQYDGQIGAPDDSGMATLSGTFTIIDGTGMFMGARGSGTLSGVINL